MWIMVAGPYSSGNASPEERCANLRALNEAALAVFRKGHVPVVGVNLALPLIEAAGSDSHEAIMMPISLAVAARCDAVLRIGGSSRGADEEVEKIRSRGGTVYSSVKEVPATTTDSEVPMVDSSHIGFWAEGPARLREGLAERRSQIDTLAKRLRGAFSASERKAVEDELREVISEYEPTEEEMKQCIHLLR